MSATLGDTSWVRLKTEVTSRLMPDSKLCLEFKTELSIIMIIIIIIIMIIIINGLFVSKCI